MPDAAQPLPVTLVIVPRFPLLSFAACTEVMRVANRESLRTAFSWTVATADGRPVQSSSGIPGPPAVALSDIAVSPITIVLSSYAPEKACVPALTDWLRRQDRAGGTIGCVDTAALILARAGVLGRDPLAVHHEVAAAFREELGEVVALDRLFTCGPRRMSSAGGTATMDMMLALVDRVRGPALAARVAEVIYHPRQPAEAPAQRPRGDTALARVDRDLARCVEIMQTHLETPLAAEAVARMAKVPPWRMRRLFRRHLDRSPAAYYLDLRLERARTLLAYSHAPVGEVALACGFPDTASFSHACRRRFGAPPSRLRRDASG